MLSALRRNAGSFISQNFRTHSGCVWGILALLSTLALAASHTPFSSEPSDCSLLTPLH